MAKKKLTVLQKGNHDKTYICVDTEAQEEILQYILKSEVIDEYQTIQQLLCENLRNKEKYCKADVSNKAKNMFEMRFTNRGRNDRIYCQEQTRGTKRYIIMIELYVGKKTEDISKKYKNRIETMGGYTYE